MTRISDLSQDLIEEILFRVPLTSQRAVLFTCKQWNGLYRDESFRKKHLGKVANYTMVIKVCDSRVCLVGFDLQGFNKQKRGIVEISTKPMGQLNHITLSTVKHCDGLLLCLPKNSSPVVWNPYLGQVRRIKPSKILSFSDRYFMGYDHNNNHKILRVMWQCEGTRAQYEIYDFKSDSWRVLNITRDDGYIPSDDGDQRGLSLKGYTYFVARGRSFLICFDYTSERFRHCLDIQSNCHNRNSVTLSAAREEQIALLFCRVDTDEIEIRITTKIEANELTWTSFFKVDVKPFGFGERFWNFLRDGFFFIDENKKLALICDSHFMKTYVIGEDSYFRIVFLEKSRWPVVCSYVPSSVQIPKGPVDA